ncbi:MAG: hypothetical protein AB3N18_04620 [Allomuricauda sp.]
MDELKSLYVDMPSWESLNVDDFIVAVGKTKTNSVYHIAECKHKPRPNKRMVRHYIKVFKSDLITALKRDPSQQLIPMTWYSRNKK